MNFLGHIFLTPDNDELLLGNFIADSVKGNPDKIYSGDIAEGIRFHRAIDHFTDNHPIVKQGISRFRESQGRWAPVVIDVVYDHVLASNWLKFHPQPLGEFTDSVYARLEAKSADFPANVQRYFPYMKAQNWLYNYQYEWGLQKSLEGLDRRTSVDTQMHESVAIYLQSVPDFLEEFSAFIKDAQGMVGDYFSA
ncbi:MAG: acyl carrier protein phosphodiesterase [Bacteroidia bacterium]|jgi:acyl carrier protein phosphodiesterase